MGRAINPVRRFSFFGATTMLTLRQSPFDLFERLEHQIATAERVPNAEIIETENGYVVRLELPGVQRNSIDIKATDRNLVISAERIASSDEATVLLSEFRSGTWSRSFRFPHSLNRETRITTNGHRPPPRRGCFVNQHTKMTRKRKK